MLSCASAMWVLGVVAAILVMLWVVVPKFSDDARRVRRRAIAFAFLRRQYLVPIPFLVVFGMSFSLLRDYGVEANVALYEALRMFVVNADLDLVGSGGDVCVNRVLWSLRIVAPVLTATGVLGFVYDKLLNRPVMLAKDHIVVVGLGKLGTALCERLLKNTTRAIIAIEKDEKNSNIANLRGKGVRVIVGDATSLAVLTRARVKHAAKFIAVTSDDFVNLESAILAVRNPDKISAELEEKKKARAIKLQHRFTKKASPWALVHVADADIRNSLAPDSEASTSKQSELSWILNAELKDFISLFSSYQDVAEQLLSKPESKDWADDGSHLVVIAGLGRLGREVMEYVLENMKQTTLWIVDPVLEGQCPTDLIMETRFQTLRKDFECEGKVAWEEFPYSSYKTVVEQLNQRVKIYSCDMMSREFGAEMLQKSRDPGVKKISFYLCTDNDVKNMNISGRLVKNLIESQDGKMMIISRRFRKSINTSTDDGQTNSKVEEFLFLDEFWKAFLVEDKSKLAKIAKDQQAEGND